MQAEKQGVLGRPAAGRDGCKCERKKQRACWEPGSKEC